MRHWYKGGESFQAVSSVEVVGAVLVAKVAAKAEVLEEASLAATVILEECFDLPTSSKSPKSYNTASWEVMAG